MLLIGPRDGSDGVKCLAAKGGSGMDGGSDSKASGRPGVRKIIVFAVVADVESNVQGLGSDWSCGRLVTSISSPVLVHPLCSWPSLDVQMISGVSAVIGP